MKLAAQEERALLHLDAAALGGLFAGVDLAGLMLRELPRAGQPPLRQRMDGVDGRELLVMPATNGRFAGVKVLTITPANGETGRPTIQGLYALFDAVTGLPLATLDAEALTAHRTAAVAAAASSKLARRDAARLTLLGSGHLVPYLAAAHASVRPIKEIRIWARNQQRREAAAARIRAIVPDLVTLGVADRAEVVGWGDIVCSATGATDPIVEGRWLRRGTHVDLVGGYRPDMRELDDAGISAGRIFVDTLQGALAEAGDLIQPLTDAVISAAAIAGDLGALATPSLVRANDDEITIFKSVGNGVADLLAASAAWTALQVPS